MTYEVKVYELVIASPSDLNKEREIVKSCVLQWNIDHSKLFNFIFMPRMWEVDTIPEINTRPQESINKQIIQNSDIMIAMFWTKLGSPTGKDISGTVEEIGQFINANKPVALYFSDKKYTPSNINSEQLDALRAYKQFISGNSYYNVFKSTGELNSMISKYLTVTATEIIKKEELQVPSDQNDKLDPKLPNINVYLDYIAVASRCNADGFWLSIVADYSSGFTNFNSNTKENIVHWATTVLRSIFPNGITTRQYGKDFVTVTFPDKDSTCPLFQVRYNNAGVVMIQWRWKNSFIPLDWLIALSLVSVVQVVNSPVVQGQTLKQFAITLSNAPEGGIKTSGVFSSSISDVYLTSRNSIWMSTVENDINIDEIIKEFIRKTLYDWGYYDFEDGLDSLIIKLVKQEFLLRQKR